MKFEESIISSKSIKYVLKQRNWWMFQRVVRGRGLKFEEAIILSKCICLEAMKLVAVSKGCPWTWLKFQEAIILSKCICLEAMKCVGVSNGCS